ncbi:VTT domain-containing protein [Saccharopolyspora phatthalungensis]|uniref:Membrane protein YqaA with SNARE-associated domain n=1 Tax=Saccharopolyspora phatthalungensis TaxID=664693 RepID=A0A840QJE4_9PSEU|nr:VTT domain-containing protein [Saccharopolyspora phatthalungensis]MBB5157883.1 membrane protein YqaA with SNARE-associated domain [Saccharopolyspora phatthalungensis]
MIAWLLTTAGTAALGSVFPLVNIELYLLGVVSTVPGVSWWALGLAAAVGQVAGKTLFYLAGKGGFTLGERLRERVEAKRRGRWAAWFEKFHRRTEERPWWGLGVLFLSAIPGIPPYSLMCFLSGAAGIPLTGFLVASLIGRSLHFLIVAGAPELLHWLPAALGS